MHLYNDFSESCSCERGSFDVFAAQPHVAMLTGLREPGHDCVTAFAKQTLNVEGLTITDGVLCCGLLH